MSDDWPVSEEPDDVDARFDALIADLDRFVPPPAPPLPRTDALTRAAWVAAIGSPTAWISLSMLGWVWQSWQLASLAAAFLGGFGILVSRMRQDHDEPDDGAVV